MLAAVLPFLCVLVDVADTEFSHVPQSPHLPMRRNIPEPINAGRFEGSFRIEAAGHSPVNDGLLLLAQYLDQPSSIADETVALYIKRSQIGNNGILLVSRWDYRMPDFPS